MTELRALNVVGRSMACILLLKETLATCRSDQPLACWTLSTQPVGYLTEVCRFVPPDRDDWSHEELHLMCKNGDESMLRLALEDGADVNAINEQRTPMLCVATWAGLSNIVALLLEFNPASVMEAYKVRLWLCERACVGFFCEEKAHFVAQIASAGMNTETLRLLEETITKELFDAVDANNRDVLEVPRVCVCVCVCVCVF
jgi:hypothetical protein